MSHMSYFYLAHSSGANIEHTMIHFTITNLVTSSHVELCSFQIPTNMSDSKSFNTLRLGVMISSKNENDFVCDLSDLTVQIIFDASWTAINTDLKGSNALNESKHAPLWHFHLHCGIEDSGSPGILCIICHQVLCQPSEHGLSSMGKHLLVEAHSAKLNESTESEVTELTSSTVEGTDLATLNRQGSQGITIVSSERKLIFNIEIICMLTELKDETHYTGSERLCYRQMSPSCLESLPHVMICTS